MSKMIQIRHVPDKIHRSLKIRATRQGMTLSDFLRREIERIAQQVTVEELVRRAKDRKISATETSADALQAERQTH